MIDDGREMKMILKLTFRWKQKCTFKKADYSVAFSTLIIMNNAVVRDQNFFGQGILISLTSSCILGSKWRKNVKFKEKRREKYMWLKQWWLQ